MNAAAQFAHSMATLLAAGLPLPRALEVTANVVSNYTFSLAVRQVRQDVERGQRHLEGRGHAFLGEARSALYAGIL